MSARLLKYLERNQKERTKKMNLDEFHFLYLKYWPWFNNELRIHSPHHPLQATQKHYKYDTTYIVWLLSDLWLKLMISVNRHASKKLQEVRMLALRIIFSNPSQKQLYFLHWPEKPCKNKKPVNKPFLLPRYLQWVLQFAGMSFCLSSV